jgi:hypothetical protein
MTIEAYIGMATIALCATAALANGLATREPGEILLSSIFAFFALTAILGSLIQ